MVRSMTGYAALTRELPHGLLQLELKSVNGRYLDIQFRMTEELRAAEPQLRELVSARVSRGKVDCRLSFAAKPLAREDVSVDATQLARLARLAAEVRKAIADAQPLRVSEVLHWPGVLAEDGDAATALRDAALAAMQDALGELAGAREREGAKLAAMIRERVALIRVRLSEIGPLVPQAIAAYEEKLTAKLREALAAADEERIRQEIAVFGVRIDVAEELSRLGAHLDEVERALAAGGAVGKRLDFLMQELNREANTLGSKSVSRELSAAALEFKLAIEQMREQVQNLE
ncbi:MAG: YicC family protein [Burkholderiales bacterium]|nr:YicC family protein [Burkholderiales bacterium]